MWLLIFLLQVVTLLLVWLLFGYIVATWLLGLFRRQPPPVFPAIWPRLSVVVPCYNEASGILAKLDDLRRQDYPADRLEIVFADGGSSDKTVELLRTAIRSEEPIRVVCCPSKGKINQLNHVLPQFTGEIFVNSDADSRLGTDALKWLAGEFAANDDVWVVGAYCRPTDGVLKIEDYYWDTQNKCRLMETDARTSSIVIAQCYAFRRNLMDSFPPDVVADDIYVAFLASARRYRTVYSRQATAVETRGPATSSEFLAHKFRKSNAYLRECLRFSYLLPEMGSFCKMMLLTKIGQQLMLPVLGIAWCLLAATLVTLFRYDIVFIDCAVLLFFLLLASRIVASTDVPGKRVRCSAVTVLRGYILTNLILLATGISYPFFRQGSSYKRIG